MVGIVCAYLKEAKPLMEWFDLKKIDDRFLIYENEKIKLIISNQGKLNSAIATTYLLSRYEIDYVLNIGIAGSSDREIGEIFLINKINENLFPDILIPHPFKESSIICFDEVVTNGEYSLVDMESEGFFKAAIKFVKTHQIFLIKIVSDNLVCFRPTQEFINNLFLPHKEKIISFINSLKSSEKIDFSEAEELAKKYNLSFSQKEMLKNRIIFYKLNNLNLPKIDFEPKNRDYNFKRIMSEFKI